MTMSGWKPTISLIHPSIHPNFQFVLLHAQPFYATSQCETSTPNGPKMTWNTTRSNILQISIRFSPGSTVFKLHAILIWDKRTKWSPNDLEHYQIKRTIHVFYIVPRVLHFTPFHSPAAAFELQSILWPKTFLGHYGIKCNPYAGCYMFYECPRVSNLTSFWYKSKRFRVTNHFVPRALHEPKITLITTWWKHLLFILLAIPSPKFQFILLFAFPKWLQNNIEHCETKVHTSRKFNSISLCV